MVYICVFFFFVRILICTLVLALLLQEYSFYVTRPTRRTDGVEGHNSTKAGELSPSCCHCSQLAFVRHAKYTGCLAMDVTTGTDIIPCRQYDCSVHDFVIEETISSTPTILCARSNSILKSNWWSHTTKVLALNYDTLVSLRILWPLSLTHVCAALYPTTTAQ